MGLTTIQPTTHSQKLNNIMEETPSNGEVPPKVPKKQVKNKKIVITVNDPSQSSEMNALLRDAIRAHLKQQNDIARSELEIEALVATCQEFMQSFIIFGYNFNGDPIEPIFFAHNQQEADALSMFLTKFFHQFIVNSNSK